ncbi:MAG: peptide ABC transporter substrate-binding protein [Chloroflexota bacterium]|nr:peptide ABC transporter substrate-binding protein [Chloroflexota bacterium]
MVTVLKRGRKSWERAIAFALLTLILPLVLAACGSSSATNTPAASAATKPVATTGAAPTTGAAAATTAPAATASTSGASASATKPAASTTASGTTAASSTTAGTTTTASTGADPRGTAPTKRGGGGTLHVLYWQAPTVLNDLVAQGTKDQAASRVIEEPLATTSVNGLTPDVAILAKEIPSTANGEIAADGKSVTWKLKDGVKWSDGTPFTSADVKATYDYIANPTNGSTYTATYSNIASVDTPDATTVTITFKDPTAAWYLPFTSYTGAILQKAQLAQCTTPQNCPANTNPIGTGPYKVKSFTSGDNIQYVINDNYREANAPFYDAIDWKGGGDAGTAAKAVIAGDADFAWNLQVTPDILKQVTDGGKSLNLTPGGGVERILLNFSDPNNAVNGEKSSPQSKSPFFTDPLVRQAISYLVDRASIATNLYGPAGNATCNILPSVPPQTNSKNTTCGFDVAKANALLDQAGWVKGSDGIRAKNGVKFNITYSTSVNAVREKEEQVIKQAFQQAGIGMDIKNADAGVFFGKGDNPDASSRFEKDMEMFTNSPGVPDAAAYFEGWTTSQISQKSNGWALPNYERYSDPQYDALVAQLSKELNQDKRNQLTIQANDYIVSHYVDIPMVDRNSVDARRTDLSNTNPTPWDVNTWNIAYWQIKK